MISFFFRKGTTLEKESVTVEFISLENTGTGNVFLYATPIGMGKKKAAGAIGRYLIGEA